MKDHILKHGAEALCRGEDLRLSLPVELDCFGVATALEIEDSIRTPTVLVIANQRAIG